MKIAAFSDTHEMFDKVKLPNDFDILICGGDFTFKGNYFKIRDFLEQLKTVANNKPVIFTPGNHELTLENQISNESQLINVYCQANNNFHYLIDKQVTINNCKIWGSPWTPWFYDWAFNSPRDVIQTYWNKIPLDTEVLVLHGPPYGILDKTREGENVGCKALLETIQTKLKALKVCIFGHIHESYGHTKLNNIDYYNVSICNRKYEPINPVTIIEI